MIRAIAKSAAVMAVLWCGSAAAVTTPQYGVPYFGIGPSAITPDSVRKSSAVSGGYQIYLGMPVDWLKTGREAIELKLLDHEMVRFDDEPNYTTALALDYIYDLGNRSTGEGFLTGTKFFVGAGGSLVRESNFGQNGTYFAANLSSGLLFPLGFKGWAIRADARVQFENNADACSDANTALGYCEKTTSLLMDTFLSAQLQIPLTIFFDKPKPLPPPTECPITVVGDQTRPDCATDSDRDGVQDGQDECPGSTAGDAVDARGCTVIKQVQ